MAAPRPSPMIRRLRRPIIAVTAVTGVAWLLPLFLTDGSGWRLGLPFQIFFTVIALLGGLFFMLLEMPASPPRRRTGLAVATRIGLVYVVTVGLLVGIGIVFPNFDTPSSGEAKVGVTPAERGEAVFFDSASTCILCHAIAGQGGTRGPDLSGVASRAVGRVTGVSAEEYIRQSILDPKAYVVDGFDPIMPANVINVLGQDDFEDIVAFLMTLE